MPKPRRSRYNVTLLRNGETSHRQIRAYSEDGIAGFYEAKGFTVVHISRAPRPKRGASVPVNWKLDHARLREAIDFLGITYPVEVKVSRSEGGSWYGQCRLIPNGPTVRRVQGGWTGAENSPDGTLSHEITVKSWVDPEQASSTLWHELTHCMQAERAIARDCPNGTLIERFRAWQNAPERGTVPGRKRRIAYDIRQCEVEANDFAASFAREVPIAA